MSGLPSLAILWAAVVMVAALLMSFTAWTSERKSSSRNLRKKRKLRPALQRQRRV